MTTEHEMAIEIAKEVGKQVPVKQVYEDAASPAVRQIGATFEDVVKCVRLVGFPIQWLAVQQDHLRAFLERSKERVPEQDRILPPPQILDPILEGIKYEFSDSTIVDMFESLLSSAMDKNKIGEAHPSYPSIIRQLAASEAHLLVSLASKSITGEIFEIAGKDNVLVPDEGTYSDKVDADDVDFFVDHLTALGLVSVNFKNGLNASRPVEGGTAHKVEIWIEPLGKRFVRTCRPRS